MTKDADVIDVVEFERTQQKERKTAFILHGRPDSGKSTFARRLSERFKGAYTDD